MKNLKDLFKIGNNLLVSGIKNKNKLLIGLSIGYFNKIIEKHPNIFYNALESRGLAKYHNGDIIGSYNDFKKNLDNFPNECSSYINISIIEMHLDMNNSAINHINKAIIMNSKSSYNYIIRAHINSKSKNYGFALDDYLIAKRIGGNLKLINKKIFKIRKKIRKDINIINDISFLYGVNFTKKNLN